MTIYRRAAMYALGKLFDLQPSAPSAEPAVQRTGPPGSPNDPEICNERSAQVSGPVYCGDSGSYCSACPKRVAAPAPLPACKGMNCGATDGHSHSLECHAEHAAAIAGGSFVAAPAPAQAEPVAALTDEEIGHVSIADARLALDNLDDFSRMTCSVDPIGPRRTLEVFISQVETPPAAAAPVAQPLTDTRILEMAAEAETPAWGEWYTDEDALFKFARAVEAHKGQP